MIMRLEATHDRCFERLAVAEMHAVLLAWFPIEVAT